MVKTPIHNVDGPDNGRKLKCPQSGRTPRKVKTIVHNVDGPDKVKKKKNLNKSTKWTDPTKGQDPFHNVDRPNKGQTYLMWTDPIKDQNPSPQSWRSLWRVEIPFCRVDGPHKEKNFTSLQGRRTPLVLAI